jgi:hypothetical protein
MRTVFEVEPEKLLVSVSDAINTLQPRSDSPAAPQVRLLIDQARQVFAESAHPRGVYQTITLTDFEQVYRGEGENDENTPVEQVIEEAVELALFVVTLGGEVSQHIEDFFAAGNAADGYILDQVASYAADELAQIAGHRFRERTSPVSLRCLLTSSLPKLASPSTRAASCTLSNRFPGCW